MDINVNDIAAAVAAQLAGDNAAASAEPTGEPVAEPAAEPVEAAEPAEAETAEPVEAAEPAEVEAPEAVAEEEPPAPVSDFPDFEAWDKESEMDSRLDPWKAYWEEQARAQAEAAAQERMNEMQLESDRYRSMYDSLSLGQEDPMIRELTEARDALTAERDELKQQIIDFQHTEKARIEAEADAEFDKFVADFKVELENPETKALGDALFDMNTDENWMSPSEAFTIVRMGPAAVEAAKAWRAKGFQPEAVVELAKATFTRSGDPERAPVKRAPSASSDIVNGGGKTAPVAPQKPAVRRWTRDDIGTDAHTKWIISQALKSG